MLHAIRHSPCKISIDKFDRADADDPGSAWDELGSSDWDINSNQLLVVTGGEILHATPHPGGASAATRVRVRFQLDDLADSAGAFLSAQSDGSDGLYAELVPDGGCVNLVLRDADSDVTVTQRVPGLTADELHTLEVCYYPATYPDAPILLAKVTLANGSTYGIDLDLTESLHADGTYVGLVGDANTRYDDFYFGLPETDTACQSVCPDCRTGCLIASDDFPGEVESSCMWGGGRLLVSHPERKTAHHVVAGFDLADGENAEVRLNMTEDGSEYHWAKLALSGSTLTLTIGKNGSTLQTKTGSGGAGSHSLTVCYDGAILTVSGSGLGSAKASTAIEDGIYVGRAGTASFTSFTFQKHFVPGEDAKCPNCPEPPADCSCCTDPQPVFAYYVDLGSPNLTNHCCGDCTLIGGEYFVPLRNPCDWFHLEGLCGEPSNNSCGACACFSLTLRLESGGQDNCKWQLDVVLNDDPGFGGSRCGCSPLHPNGFFVRYESAPFARDQCGVMPRTLTKVSESHGPGPDLLCDGNMPSTAILRTAA